VHEPCVDRLGGATQRLGQRVEELSPCRAGSGAEPELLGDQRLSGQKQRGCFVGGEGGELRSETIEQLDSTADALHRVDRYAGRTEGVDVTQDRAR